MQHACRHSRDKHINTNMTSSTRQASLRTVGLGIMAVAFGAPLQVMRALLAEQTGALSLLKTSQ